DERVHELPTTHGGEPRHVVDHLLGVHRRDLPTRLGQGVDDHRGQSAETRVVRGVQACGTRADDEQIGRQRFGRTHGPSPLSSPAPPARAVVILVPHATRRGRRSCARLALWLNRSTGSSATPWVRSPYPPTRSTAPRLNVRSRTSPSRAVVWNVPRSARWDW